MLNQTEFAQQPLKDFVRATVLTAWQDRREGVLLSQLGSEIATKLPAELVRAELGKRKLVNFIEDELDREIVVFSGTRSRLTLLAVPRKAGIREDEADQYLPKGNSLNGRLRAAGIRKAVVVAFTRPIEPGHKRLITLEPITRFDDVPADAEVPDGAKVLEEHFLVLDENTPAEIKGATLLQNIAAWRKSAELQPHEITQKTRSEDRPVISVLDLVLSTLDESEQRRINMPLDVIAKLRARIVR